jgi:hypothetical protein
MKAFVTGETKLDRHDYEAIPVVWPIAYLFVWLMWLFIASETEYNLWNGVSPLLRVIICLAISGLLTLIAAEIGD